MATNKKETQAEKNARIEKELRARGAKFQTKAQVVAQRERAGKKQAAAAPAVAPRGNGNGAATARRRPVEYVSGKAFDETTRKAMKSSGAD